MEGELGRTLDKRMQAMAAFGFSGQVLAAKTGKVLLDAAYGWANRSDQRPMRSDTPIGIASMTKQFSAAAIMKLKEAGKLTLEEPIGRFLPRAPADKAALTLGQLLSHTAGLAPGDLSGDFELDKKGVLASVYRSTLLPAGEWRYSNAGYNLAAAVIEGASGRSYEDYLTDEIFRPAGMLRTGFPKHRSLAEGDASHAYRAWIDQGSPATWPKANYRPWGGGTAFSTAQDIFRWQRMLEGGRILSPGSVASLIASHAKPNQRNPKLGYAYGAFVEETENGFFIERSGDWERGYNAAWHRWSQEDMTLIIVSNSVSPSGLSMRQYVQLSLEELMRGKVPTPQQSPRRTLTLAERRSLAGDYPTADGSVRLRHDGAYLWATAVGQSAVELLSPADAAVTAGQRAAASQTAKLFEALKAGRDAYPEVLEATDAATVQTYRDEWTAASKSRGAFINAEILGAVEYGPGVRTVSQLNFQHGHTVMTHVWADKGAGKLVETLVNDGLVPAAVAYCVAPGSADGVMINRIGEAFTVDRRATPHLVFKGETPTVLAKRV